MYDIPLIQKKANNYNDNFVSSRIFFLHGGANGTNLTRHENHILTNMCFLCKSFSHHFWVTIFTHIHQVWTSSVVQNFCLDSIFFISSSVHLSSSFKILVHRYQSTEQPKQPPRPPNCSDCGVDGLTPQRPCRRRRRHAAQASSPHGDP